MTSPTWTCGFCRTAFNSEKEFKRHTHDMWCMACNKDSSECRHGSPRDDASARAEPDMQPWETINVLRARVKEFEEYGLAHLGAIGKATARAEEDLRRKRDECERLESLIGDVRRQTLRIAAERDDARAALAASALEIAKLRRELRGKR